jgi:hypothetical protein
MAGRSNTGCGSTACNNTRTCATLSGMGVYGSSVGGSVVEVDSGTVVVGFTVLATVVEYQIKGEWLEQNATTITGLVLIGIGMMTYVGFLWLLISDGFAQLIPKRYAYRL